MSQFSWPLMVNNIPQEDLNEVIEFLKTGPILTQSSHVAAFEQEWSSWLGVKYSVFLNSGSSANILTFSVLKALYGAGEVIVGPLGWVSDIVALLVNGFTPVFADINPRTLSIDEDEVVKKITGRTKAVLLIHVQGFNGCTERLLTVLNEKGIPLIEDACESHGATHKGRKVGSLGLVSNFSFYFAHHMSTIEGGMFCTDDERLYQTARMFRSHGMTREMTDENMKNGFRDAHPDLNPQFIFAYPGFNMRNTEIGAVLGRAQLKRLDENIRMRNRSFKYFLDNLDSNKYFTEFELEGSSNYALNLVLREPDDDLRDKVMRALTENGIEFRRGSAGGGNQMRQPYLRTLLRPDEHLSCPRVDHIHFYGFYIGNYPDLQTEQIARLCTLLNGII